MKASHEHIGTAKLLPGMPAHALLIRENDPRWFRVFWEGKKPISNHPFIDMRLSMEKEFLLSGMRLPENLRGLGLGDSLMEIAFRISDATGIPFRHTVKIRKPTIAKKLHEFGFQPDEPLNFLQIIPCEEDQGPIPHAILFKQKGRNVVNGTDFNKWYIIQEERTLEQGEEAPIDAIPIETRWSLIDLGLNKERRAKTAESLPGRIQIFPRRILKHLAV
jgi:hypothetical protein